MAPNEGLSVVLEFPKGVLTEPTRNQRLLWLLEDNLTLAGASGAMAINYDKPTLTALRVSYGTFVRVPGSWKDFQ